MLKPEDTVKIKAREPSGTELIILQLFVNISPFNQKYQESFRTLFIYTKNKRKKERR